MSKLDQIISGQKSLNDRMIKLEKVLDVQNDEELIKVIKTLVIYILFKYYAILHLLLVFRIFGLDPDRISQKSGFDLTRSESENNYLAIQ